ncbi:hypothetical protein L345_08029, partial [Ophiophagus hannah]
MYLQCHLSKATLHCVFILREAVSNNTPCKAKLEACLLSGRPHIWQIDMYISFLEQVLTLLAQQEVEKISVGTELKWKQQTCWNDHMVFYRLSLRAAACQQLVELQAAGQYLQPLFFQNLYSLLLLAQMFSFFTFLGRSLEEQAAPSRSTLAWLASLGIWAGIGRKVFAHKFNQESAQESYEGLALSSVFVDSSAN